MLHVIGWGIAILIATVLGVICIGLFVPIRYEGKAEFPGEFKNAAAYFRMSWFMHIVSFRWSFEKEESTLYCRVAWKNLGKDQSENSMKDDFVEPEVVERSELSDEKRKVHREVARRKGKKGKKRSTFERIKDNIQYTFKKLCDRIKKMEGTKEKISEFLSDKDHQEAYARIMKEKIWLKRFLNPKCLKLQMRYGFDDPYYTGLSLAFLGAFYSFIGGWMDVEPDFENQICDGTFYIKGKIRFFYGIVFGLKIISDASVRKTFHDIMNRKNA